MPFPPRSAPRCSQDPEAGSHPGTAGAVEHFECAINVPGRDVTSRWNPGPKPVSQARSTALRRKKTPTVTKHLIDPIENERGRIRQLLDVGPAVEPHAR